LLCVFTIKILNINDLKVECERKLKTCSWLVFTFKRKTF
jgi:hypothetical protein